MCYTDWKQSFTVHKSDGKLETYTDSFLFLCLVDCRERDPKSSFHFGQSAYVLLGWWQVRP